jgi:hypothetical protein
MRFQSQRAQFVLLWNNKNKLFNAGIIDKNKRARPGAVAHDMLYHFESNLCLTEAQILAYFSRLSAKQKKKAIKKYHQLQPQNQL